jgi:membrane protease YdiL (CAAX protease family)
LLSFLLIMLTFIFFVLGTWLALRLVHRRKMRTLISADGSIRWRRIAQGFAAWLILAALQGLVEAWLHPGRYVWTFNPGSFFLFLAPILLLIPIQTSAEEFFFRGYLLQGFGLKVRSIWLLSLLSGVLFALPHMANPEVSVNFWLLLIYYFLSGAFMAYITLKDQRLELALGMHAANNIFTAIFANYTISALATPALFTVQELDAVYSLAAYILSIIVFYLVFFRPGRTNGGQNA